MYMYMSCVDGEPLTVDPNLNLSRPASKMGGCADRNQCCKVVTRASYISQHVKEAYRKSGPLTHYIPLTHLLYIHYVHTHVHIQCIVYTL